MLSVLVDNGVVSASDFAEDATQPKTLAWGSESVTTVISGFQRVSLDADPEMQLQKDALFTIGRLSRERKIQLFTYWELMAEQWRRGKARDLVGNAFRGCAWKHCRPALERSAYFQGMDMKSFIAKGGRKDRKAGDLDPELSQIHFFKFLLALEPESVAVLLDHGPALVNDEFERESLKDLNWFKCAAGIAPSAENLPDFFHLWTARRNSMDVFLTLEKKLPAYANQLEKQRLLGALSVFRPTNLAHKLGVAQLDPVPLEIGKFYSYADLLGNPFDGWEKKS